MNEKDGRSPASQGRAATPSGPSPAVSGIADIPNAEPDWFEAAKAMANAIMFQRSTRREHVVGRDGRVRVGMVDLLGCYIVDDAAREFCELAGLPFGDVEVPNEHQAFFMSLTGRKWPDWFTDRDAIIEGAGPSPGKGKVDFRSLASGIEARSAATGTGAAEGKSPAPEGGDAQRRQQ